jgi:hypothetical protein
MEVVNNKIIVDSPKTRREKISILNTKINNAAEIEENNTHCATSHTS